MTTLRTLRKLLLGETWLLPLGIAAVVLAASLVAKPVLGGGWDRAGGFVILAGIVAVLVASVALSSRPRR
jgi:hypothetical protein